MVLVFGGFLAAGMPIGGAIASIGGALAVLLGFSYLIDLDAAVVNVVTVLGLGLCIDYGLLIVSRYREELREPSRREHDQIDPRGAHRRTGRDDDDGRSHGDVLRHHRGDQPVRADDLPGPDPQARSARPG